MNFPTAQEIKLLHKKYAPTNDAFNLVFTHCQIIWDIAEQLIRNSNLSVDMELVKAGCLLHDIGLYKLIDTAGNIDPQHIKHGILGHDLLRHEGYPEIICRFASHHTGVGLTKADVLAQKLPLPMQSYVPETAEEALVTYADKFHSKSQPPCFITYKKYKEYVAGFGSDKVERFERMAKQFGLPDLDPIITKYGHEVKGS